VKKFLSIVPRWFPALFFMVVIFIFSSRSGDQLPNFLDWDYVFKKIGHAIGYGLLALSYFHYLKYDNRKYWLAWLMALVFSTTDEFHQSFVPGRHPSIVDVLVFDNFGAVIGLWLYFITHSLHVSRS
jgi:VanZ family protein